MVRLKRLGKYELIKRLAVGGMAEIYLASQGGLHGVERAVIVKCIRRDLDTEREVLDMFLDEARIAACLKHPNIVHLYDVGEEQGIPYLAMEYVFGRDLGQICDRARMLGMELPVPFIVKVMCDALAGLYYAHFTAEYEDRPLNVIHRDISPQNLLVSFDGVAKVVDFGIAKAASRLSKTQAGVLKGKYAFMSPEQVLGEPLDHRSDQFSVSVLTYEAITGTRLFLRDKDYNTMEAVDACEIPPIRLLRKDVPRKLARAINRALKHSPKKRHRSCRDMERAFDKVLHGSNVERTEVVASFMRKLFADELVARDRAISHAQGTERDLLTFSGFEMLDSLDAKAGEEQAVPPAPIAALRVEEILNERQGKQTQLHGTALSKSGKASKSSWYSDWRFLILVFTVVMLLCFYLLVSTEKSPGDPESSNSRLERRPLKQTESIARKKEQVGFLSVSVRPSVQVMIDGENLGKGAFRKRNLSPGHHEVELSDKNSGQQESFSVDIERGDEFILDPSSWQ
jgi:serine/threonine protein kinase